jgi:SAM-dependent methyltransferase
VSVKRQYDEIADIYDLLSEGDDGALYFRMYAEKFLKQLKKHSCVLDCSCGTGDHAIWLARQHFRTYASDLSKAMLQKAIDKARNAGQDIQFFASSWKNLHLKAPVQFPLIFSPGNSFSHLESISMLDESMNGIKLCLEDDGIFAFDIRNWEKTFSDSNLVPQEFEAGKRGNKYRVKYSWDIRGWNTTCKMLVETLRINTSEYRKYEFDFFPIGYDQLKESMQKAGFNKVDRKYYPDDNYYFVSAK